MPLRHRARAVPPRQADPRLGRQHSRHQRPPVALHRGGAPQRRQASTPSTRDRNRTGDGRRPPLLHQPRQRHRARPRHDARHHRRRVCTTPITSRATPKASTACASASREWTPAARRRAHRHSGRRHRRAGPRIRHHAPRRDPPQLRRAAQRARRHGRAHHRAAARAHRILEGDRRRPATLHLAGPSSSTAPAWSAPTCNSSRSAARRASST